MEARLEKELNNKVNRRCNCDDANTSKVVEAAQEQLAAKAQLAGCDLTRSALAKIECGQRSIYPDELKALHEALHIPYESLLQ